QKCSRQGTDHYRTGFGRCSITHIFPGSTFGGQYWTVQIFSNRCYLYGYSLYLCIADGYFLEKDELCRSHCRVNWRCSYSDSACHFFISCRYSSSLVICWVHSAVSDHAADRNSFTEHYATNKGAGKAFFVAALLAYHSGRKS